MKEINRFKMYTTNIINNKNNYSFDRFVNINKYKYLIYRFFNNYNIQYNDEINNKDWVRFKSAHKDIYTRIFLFGFIPLYIKEVK